MKVSLIYPRTGMDKKGVTIGLPLSILHLAAYLKDCDVEIIDRRLGEKEPTGDVVCVSCMTGFQIKDALKAVEGLDKPVIFGGVHPSCMPEQTLEMVDCVVVGEGELALPKALQNPKGIVQAIDLPNLDETPELPYHLINPKDYFRNVYKSRNTLHLLVGKGCPHRCKYCYNHFFNKGRWRGMSPEKMIEGVKKLKSLGAESVDLVDDNFFVSKDRVEKFCELLQKEELDLKFFTNCRADYVCSYSNEFLNSLKDCGFQEFFVGVESGSDRMLDLMHKDIKVKQVLEANKKLKKAGIKPVYSFMCGFPHETNEEVKQTIDLMIRLKKENPSCSLTSIKIYTPFPGTEFYHECIELGMKMPSSLEEWGDFDYNTTKFKNDVWLEKLSYITYFLDQDTMLEVAKNPLLKLLVRIYSKIVWWRCSNHFYALMPEWRIIKWVVKNL